MPCHRKFGSLMEDIITITISRDSFFFLFVHFPILQISIILDQIKCMRIYSIGLRNFELSLTKQSSIASSMANFSPPPHFGLYFQDFFFVWERKERKRQINW